MQRKYASDIAGVSLDCDIRTGQRIIPGIPTDNTAPINAFLALATPSDPVELIIDGGAAVGTLVIPDTGSVTIRGCGWGTGFFLQDGTNGDFCRNASAASSVDSWSPQQPENIRGYNICFSDFFVNLNGDNISTTGTRQGIVGSYFFTGFQLHAYDGVLFDNVYVYDSPAYGINLYACKRVKVRGCQVVSPGRYGNTDGVHFNGGCYDCIVDGCYFATGDDPVAINLEEGDHSSGKRFVVSNCTLDDCSTGVRVYGNAVTDTYNVMVTNCVGDVRSAFLVCGVDIPPSAVRKPAIKKPDVNHSVTLSNIDVKVTRQGAFCLLYSSVGSLVFENCQMNEPTIDVPFFLIHSGVRGDLRNVAVSSLVFDNCQIYRSDTGHAPAFWIDLREGSIGTVALSSCSIRNEFGKTYSNIPCLIHLSNENYPTSVSYPVITMLRMNGCDFDGCQSIVHIDAGQCLNYEINGLVLRSRAAAELQLSGVTDDGGLWHTIRHGDTTWQVFGDVTTTMAGDPGRFVALACAEVNGELQLSGVTDDGGVWHTIRHADTIWQPFGNVKDATASNPGRFSAVACAEVNGELQLSGVTNDGGLWHTIRHADTTWQPFGNVKDATASDPGRFVALACAEVNGELQLSGVTDGGGLWHTIRHADTTWQAFGNVKTTMAGDPGRFVALACAG